MPNKPKNGYLHIATETISSGVTFYRVSFISGHISVIPAIDIDLNLAVGRVMLRVMDPYR